MSDDLRVCTAAFFRIKGKDVVTKDEFKMSVALDLKWMSVKEAEMLLNRLAAEKLVAVNGNYVKPAADLSDVQVPIAYRPSEEFKKEISPPAPAPPRDLFAELMDIAAANGLNRGKFVAECNAVKKKLNIDTCAAALLVLRDSGIDIGKVKDLVYTQVQKI